MPGTKGGPSIGASSSKVFVTGGPTATFHIYDVTTDAWAAGTNGPRALLLLPPLSVAWSVAWSAALPRRGSERNRAGANLPAVALFPTGAVKGSTFYVVGGSPPMGTPGRVVHQWDILASQWTTGARAATVRTIRHRTRHAMPTNLLLCASSVRWRRLAVLCCATREPRSQLHSIPFRSVLTGRDCNCAAKQTRR
jgi:hypothetical protein